MTLFSKTLLANAQDSALFVSLFCRFTLANVTGRLDNQTHLNKYPRYFAS